MRVLILNSGMGSRMGELTAIHPKCMTDIPGNETILSRQLKQIVQTGITDVVITTGRFDKVLVDYVNSLALPLRFTYVLNPIYKDTNYIYSIYCAREELDDDIILMHGDLVFDNEVMNMVLAHKGSCMTVSSTLPLPEKDFKAVLQDGKVMKVGVEFFDDAVEAQAFYKLEKKDWHVWLDRIIEFCEAGNRKCYAEKALNELKGACNIDALDVQDLLCSEVDTPEDLVVVSQNMQKLKDGAIRRCW